MIQRLEKLGVTDTTGLGGKSNTLRSISLSHLAIIILGSSGSAAGSIPATRPVEHLTPQPLSIEGLGSKVSLCCCELLPPN